ncbi:hypothetical protein [Litorimonas haliclonae]|uniref:hypothetical protein n=1 Tax=Litorimonas haliclonae TaxID=2081977 RepID=UPI0039EDF2A9
MRSQTVRTRPSDELWPVNTLLINVLPDLTPLARKLKDLKASPPLRPLIRGNA